MRKLNFSRIVYIALLISLFCTPLGATDLNGEFGESVLDSVCVDRKRYFRERYGDHRTYRGYEGWKRIVPTHLKLQYAGDMGMFAVGCGWDYGRKEQWETDFMIGILPGKYADKTHLTCTVKQNYTPFSLQINRSMAFQPLTCGLYMTMIYGEKYWVREPSKYPMKHYYGFTTRIRFNVYVGESITFNLSQTGRVRDLSLYYELSANDLNIVSKCTNSWIKLKDIIFFSAGVKLHIIGKGTAD